MRLSALLRIFETSRNAILLIIGKTKAAISGFRKRANDMPVPTSMGDLSVTESANSPAGTDAISNSLDNYLRAVQAILRTTNNKSADIASGASVAIGAATGEFISITGTTTITSFDSVSAGIRRDLYFPSALVLTHSSSIQLPGGVNHTTTAGDVLSFRSLGAGQWLCTGIMRIATVDLMRTVKKKTSQTSNSSGTLTIDAELQGFTIKPTKNYRLRGCLSLLVDNCGIKIAIGISGGSLSSPAYSYILPVSSAMGSIATEPSSTTASAGSVTGDLIIDGVFTGHATDTLTLSLYWAANVNNGNLARVRASSWLELEEI